MTARYEQGEGDEGKKERREGCFVSIFFSFRSFVPVLLFPLLALPFSPAVTIDRFASRWERD